MDAGRLSVVVPVRDEELTIATLLRRVVAAEVPGMVKQVIVVDDGSRDGTSELLEDECRRAGHLLLRHARSRGKGAAIRTALPHVTGSIVVIQDGDLEYDPGDYAALVEPIRAGRSRVVYGSRMRGAAAAMGRRQRAVNRALAAVASRLGRSRVTDEATCLKAFSAKLLRALPLRCRGFEFCAEVTALLQAAGEPIAEVPIRYRPRSRAEGKKVRARDGLIAVWWLLWSRFGRRRERGVAPTGALYRWALIALLAVAVARPLVENLRYPLLTGWDSWNFLGLAAVVADGDGLIPGWDHRQLQPEGRPFLYPPLVPVLVSALAGVSGLSPFAVIKGATVVLYPALIAMVVAVARLAGDRRVVVASAAFMLSVNQAFLLSISALAQAVELLLYLLVIAALHRRRYVAAGAAYGLAFWTHTFTPFCFGAGLLLWAAFRREERRRVLATVAGGVLLGSPWLLRLASHSEWVRPNADMAQHTTLSGWAWAVSVEGFAFLVMAVVLAGILLADRTLARRLWEDRLASLLACTAAGLALTSYYPERSLTYMAPAVAILLALAVFRASPQAVRAGLWLGVAVLGFVALDGFGALELFTPPGHLVVALVVAGAVMLAFHAFRAGRAWPLALLIVLVFIDPEGRAPPFASWAEPAQVARSRLASEAWDACAWMAARHPRALVATSDFRITAACSSMGLRTTTGTIMEFSRDGNIYSAEGADYHLVAAAGDDTGRLWQRGPVAIYPASARRLGDAGAPGANDYGPPNLDVRLLAVGFDNSIPVVGDRLAPEIFWRLGPGEPDWIPGKKWPIAYRAGELIKLHVRLEVNVLSGGFIERFDVEGSAQIGGEHITFRRVRTGDGPGAPATFEADRPLPRRIIHDQLVTIRWSARAEMTNGDWTGEVGASDHHFYVTGGTPRPRIGRGPPVPSAMYYSVLRHTAASAHGVPSENATLVVDGIWRGFAGLRVSRHSFDPATGAPDGDSRRLRFWGTASQAGDQLQECPNHPEGPVAFLLANPDAAKCGQWAELLRQAFAIHGIDSDVDFIDCSFRLVPPGSCELLVKRWDFGTATGGSWPYARGQFREAETLDAQGNSDPPGRFDGHYVVRNPTGGRHEVYDPSFGTTFPSLAAWEEHSLDGFRRCYWTKRGGKDFCGAAAARRNTGTQETHWQFGRTWDALGAGLAAAVSGADRGGIAAILRDGGFTIRRFEPPAPGTLTATVATSAAGAAAARAPRVVIAKARRTFRTARRQRVKIRLTRPGRRALRRAGRRMRVTVTLTFRATPGVKVKRSRAVTLRR